MRSGLASQWKRCIYVGLLEFPILGYKTRYLSCRFVWMRNDSDKLFDLWWGSVVELRQGNDGDTIRRAVGALKLKQLRNAKKRSIFIRGTGNIRHCCCSIKLFRIECARSPGSRRLRDPQLPESVPKLLQEWTSFLNWNVYWSGKVCSQRGKPHSR